MEPETVAVEFDLELADVYRALTYYYDNIDEMANGGSGAIDGLGRAAKARRNSP